MTTRIYTEVKPNASESVFDKPFYVPVVDGSLSSGDVLSQSDLTALMGESGYLSDAYVVETEIYIKGEYYEENADGEYEYCEGSEPEVEKINVDVSDADAVYADLNKRAGVPYISFEEIAAWLADEANFDDWLNLGSSRYIPSANSDEFRGIVEFYLERRLRIVPVEREVA